MIFFFCLWTLLFGKGGHTLWFEIENDTARGSLPRRTVIVGCRPVGTNTPPLLKQKRLFFFFFGEFWHKTVLEQQQAKETGLVWPISLSFVGGVGGSKFAWQWCNYFKKKKKIKYFNNNNKIRVELINLGRSIILLWDACIVWELQYLQCLTIYTMV